MSGAFGVGCDVPKGTGPCWYAAASERAALTTYDRVAESFTPL